MIKNNNINETEIEQGAPVCEKCGNIKLWEPFDLTQVESSGQMDDSKEGRWVCPHCQGEIDFLGEEDE
jgi:hypothetical protein